MDLSIIIADSNDLRVKRCVNSIDEDVEIFISLNSPSSDLIKLIKTLDVKYCVTPQKGLSLALNRGIEESTKNNVLIIDSDCVFKPGTINKLYNGLKDYPMVRGVQITLFNNIFQKIIAKSREFHGNTNPDPQQIEIRAYKPLAYRKDIRKILNGRIYNDKLKLSEDFEMNERRKSANIKLGFIPEAIIYHDPINIYSDLKSAYKYGMDRYICVNEGLTKPKKNFLQSCRKLYNTCLPKYGFAVSTYMLLWTLSYDLGYKFAGAKK